MMKRGGILVTGATGLLGRLVLDRLVANVARNRIYVLVRDIGRWERTVRECGYPRQRFEVVLGDVGQPGAGLSAGDRRRLRGEVRTVVHLAADIAFSRTLEEARRTNTRGTEHVLDVIAGCDALFTYVSTAFVAGRACGRIRESDPGGREGFVNTYEQSKWEAEQAVRRSGEAFLILRSSTIVCDSVAGGVTQFNAVHGALRILQAGLAPMLPGDAKTPVDVVTAEHVARAVGHLAGRADLAGETLHLCAGEGAAKLSELLDLTHRLWSEDSEWRRRGLVPPALTDLATYRLFEDAVEQTADARLCEIARAMSTFLPQLGYAKDFDTTLADSLVGRAPPVLEFWPNMIRALGTKRVRPTARRAAA